MNNKTLLIILIALGAIYALTQIFAQKKDRSFNTELIKIDTAAVSSITIIPKGEDSEINLTKEPQGWIASNGTLSVKATSGSVQNILDILTLVKTKRIAAKNPEKWSEYEVEAGKATQIKVYSGTNLLEDFVVGRFTYNQPPGGFQQGQQPNFNNLSFTSFVRLTDEDEVYAVDGTLSMTLGNQKFDNFREKQLFNMPAGVEVTDIAVLQPDNTPLYSMVLNNGQWTLNGTEPLDSVKVADYVSSLGNVSGYEFADDFDDAQAKNYLIKTLVVRGNNLLDPISVQCYADTSRTKPFVIRSTHNQAYFSSDSTGIYDRLFKDVSAFSANTD